MRLVGAISAAAMVALGFAAPAVADVATFAYTGGEQTFTVPAGSTSIQVTAIGASAGTAAGNGGRGATVSGPLDVTAGQVLYVEVGGVGAHPDGGFNGGGDAGIGVGLHRGGGGASDVRTISRDAAQSLESRLLVAGGGGGTGYGYGGGDAGADGQSGACGGKAGTNSAGGAAGTSTGGAGSAGVLGAGGKGADGGGGGGGGGLYGGGGGGYSTGDVATGCGGGGGSSKVPAGGTSGLADRTTPPSIEITYTAASPGGPGGPGSDTVAPVLSALGLTHPIFSPAGRGPGFVALGAAVGTRVSYMLTEPARARFTVGRLVHRRRGRRYVKLRGGFTQQGVAGTNRLKFRGRLRGHALRRGRYRLVAVATDLAGNRSAPAMRKFRIR